MPKLKIDTTKSLYDPIEIEVNGHIYKITSLSTEFFEKMDRFDAMVIDEGKLEGNALFLNACLGMPMKLAKLIDIRTINEIKLFIAKVISNAEPKNVGSGGTEETK
jgi:hypothetical protein